MGAVRGEFDRAGTWPSGLPGLAADDASAVAAWSRAVRDGVLVAFADLSRWSAWSDGCRAVLSAEEQARVDRRRRPSDRGALAVAYALHRELLGAVLGCAPASVRLGRDQLGCPYVAGDIVRTSLSHADGFAAFAVSAAGPVGVDLELATRAPELRAIAGRICHADDARRVDPLPDDERDAALLQLWVCKEAALKAAGIGLAREMNEFPIGDGAHVAVDPSGRHPVRVHLLVPGNEWVAAVAAPPAAYVRQLWLTPPRWAPPLHAGNLLHGMPAQERFA